MPVETIVARLDRLVSRHVPSLLRLNPLAVDRVIETLLAEIGTVLATDSAAFAAGDSPGCKTARTWTRPGAMPDGEPLTLPVVVGGQRLGVLTVGPAPNGEPFPLVVEERLRVLAELMTLTVQCGERLLALARAGTESGPASLVDDGPDGGDFEDIIGDSPLLQVAIARILEVAPTDATVVLMGETGTGKELFARAVHNRSRRRGRPFVRVNCAALPPTLNETELFGHERGAFTGAVSMRRGRFELADKGTLFLDEVGDLPLDVQAKLLRVLQEGEFERVGSSESRSVDVRVVAATHHDLESAVKEGRFRTDLYYRLNVFPIALPPLRERKGDVPLLARFYIDRFNQEFRKRVRGLSADATEVLQQYGWPGNVRELRNAIERAMLLIEGDLLEPEHFTTLTRTVATTQFRLPPEGVNLDEVERQLLLQALERANGNQTQAAQLLGINRDQVRYRIEKFGLSKV